MKLKPTDFTFTMRRNGVEIEMDALAAKQLCERLESFGEDCSDSCKKMRKDIRDKINICTLNQKARGA